MNKVDELAETFWSRKRNIGSIRSKNSLEYLSGASPEEAAPTAQTLRQRTRQTIRPWRLARSISPGVFPALAIRRVPVQLIPKKFRRVSRRVVRQFELVGKAIFSDMASISLPSSPVNAKTGASDRRRRGARGVTLESSSAQTVALSTITLGRRKLAAFGRDSSRSAVWRWRTRRTRRLPSLSELVWRAETLACETLDARPTLESGKIVSSAAS